VDPSATVAQAPVITVIFDSANADGPRALFELVEAAKRTRSQATTEPQTGRTQSGSGAAQPVQGRRQRLHRGGVSGCVTDSAGDRLPNPQPP
jgi:hypothetical protein